MAGEYGVVVVGCDVAQLAELLLGLVGQELPPLHLQIVAYGTASDRVAAMADELEWPPSVECSVRQAPEVADAVQAANSGMRWLCERNDGVLPAHVAIVDERARPAHGWLHELQAVLTARTVRTDGIEWNGEDYGNVGFAGPVTDQTAHVSQRLTLEQADVAQGVTAYAARRRQLLSGVASAASSLDGFCVLGTEAAWRSISTFDGRPLDATLGGWAWADAWVRAANMRWRCVVAEGCYVGRAQQVRSGAWQAGDGAGRLAYYAKHAPPTAPVVVAALCVRITTLRGLALLRATIASLAHAVDSIAIVLGNNPLDVQDDKAFDPNAPMARTDVELLRACSGASAQRCAEALERWCRQLLQASGAAQPAVARVRAWDRLANDYGERALCYDVARTVCEADWLFAIEPAEVLEEGVTRAFLHRLATHPDPAVRGYDVAFLTHHESADLVREDAPWGDGGSWKGGPAGVRIFRAAGAQPARTADGQACSAAPTMGEDAVRVAAVRLRRLGLLRAGDRERAGVDPGGDGVRCYTYQPANRVGFHALFYERENVDDVGRWLDAANGLCDRSVLVWTSSAKLPAQWRALAAHYDAHVVQHELQDNLAAARNAGINALATAQPALTWAWFVDPDEWFHEPLNDARAVRRMAESSRWGWLVQVANYRKGEAPTVSDSVRFSRLDAAGIMRMDGRVHEGFGAAIHQLQARGVYPRLVYAPFVVQHRGMAFDSARMREKLDQYERMLRLDLQDNPMNPGAWVSLGWHYMNDGAQAEGEECLRRAVHCAGRSYLPFKELAYVHLRTAKALVAASIDRLTPTHQWWNTAQELAHVLEAQVPNAPVVARDSAHAVQPLPAWPLVYDAEKEGA